MRSKRSVNKIKNSSSKLEVIDFINPNENLQKYKLEKKKQLYKQKLKESLKNIVEKEFENSRNTANRSASKIERARNIANEQIHDESLKSGHKKLFTIKNRSNLANTVDIDPKSELLNYNLHKNDEKLNDEINQATMETTNRHLNDTSNQEFYYEYDSDDLKINPIRKLDFNETGVRKTPYLNDSSNVKEALGATNSRNDSKEHVVNGVSTLKSNENQLFNRSCSHNLSKHRFKEILKKYDHNKFSDSNLKGSNKFKSESNFKKSMELIKKEIDRELFCNRCNQRNKSYWDKRKEGLYDISTEIDSKPLKKSYSQSNVTRKTKVKEINYKCPSKKIQQKKREDLAMIDTNLPISPMRKRNSDGQNFSFQNDKNARSYYRTTPNKENARKSPYRQTKKYQTKETLNKSSINSELGTYDIKKPILKKHSNLSQTAKKYTKYSVKEISQSPLRANARKISKDKNDAIRSSIYSKNLETHLKKIKDPKNSRQASPITSKQSKCYSSIQTNSMQISVGPTSKNSQLELFDCVLNVLLNEEKS